MQYEPLPVDERAELANSTLEHVKELLTVKGDRAIEEYSRLMRCIRQEDNISAYVYKTADGGRVAIEPTYLCVQCPVVSKTRERHRKDHPFGQYIAPYLYPPSGRG